MGGGGEGGGEEGGGGGIGGGREGGGEGTGPETRFKENLPGFAPTSEGQVEVSPGFQGNRSPGVTAAPRNHGSEQVKGVMTTLSPVRVCVWRCLCVCVGLASLCVRATFTLLVTPDNRFCKTALPPPPSPALSNPAQLCAEKWIWSFRGLGVFGEEGGGGAGGLEDKDVCSSPQPP